VLCNEAVQLQSLWGNGARKVRLNLRRQERITPGSKMHDTVSQINDDLDTEGIDPYDHVLLLQSGRVRWIECSRDPSVVLVPVAGKVTIGLASSDSRKTLTTGLMIVTPGSGPQLDKWIQIRPDDENSKWMEIRKSSQVEMGNRSAMFRANCTKGSECQHSVCGWSNHAGKAS
jgi:hypothetical protein